MSNEGYTFEISLSVLNHLGRNLYRNFITVLGEAISNSWDADANNVWITIDKKTNTMILKDDGIGMSDTDFQGRFLKIGYSKRKDNITHSPSGRPFIGRKGIGKLALLSCADRVHIVTKTLATNPTGGVIDNSELDTAIVEDLTPQQYPLGKISEGIKKHLKGMDKGTVLFFENIKDGIPNTLEYLEKVIALYFRFALVDKAFSIFLNGNEITLDKLSGLVGETQFTWRINETHDPFLIENLYNSSSVVEKESITCDDLQIEGFIASVEKPSQLKIRGTDEKVTLDLFVNGRLREKDILKHISSTRIVESYIYGQIHYNDLDDIRDRFTSSREGVVQNDEKFTKLIEVIKGLLLPSGKLFDRWDELRIKHRKAGEIDNPRKSNTARYSRLLFNEGIGDILPQQTFDDDTINDWIRELEDEVEFNLPAYKDCFVAENIVRKYILHKSLQITDNNINERMAKRKRDENARMVEFRISFDIRKNSDGLYYVDMDDLIAIIGDRPINGVPMTGALPQYAKQYALVRNPVAHTALVSNNAKNLLNLTFENIKARIQQLLSENTP